jgi:segregation and condensation protein B
MTDESSAELLTTGASTADAEPHRLKGVVEALIFASPEPITLKQLVKLLDPETKEDVRAALEELQAGYASSAGLQLVEVAGGYQIVTRPELHEWVRRLFASPAAAPRLSVQALETLAVIAYKQPVTALEIAEIRGVNTAGVLGTLLDRKLIRIAGRKAVVGRPFMYATTREFLDRFGLNDLSDLPKVEDMAELLGFELPAVADEGEAQALPFQETGDGRQETGEGNQETGNRNQETGDGRQETGDGEPDSDAGSRES